MKLSSIYTILCVDVIVLVSMQATMVPSKYTKIRILCLWRQGFGPTRIVELLHLQDGIKASLCLGLLEGM